MIDVGQMPRRTLAMQRQSKYFIGWRMV